LRAARDEKPIEAEGLGRRFGDLVAVAGIDLVVEQGEVFGFLGPNGAGKSTTTRMLTILLKPTAGRARVADDDSVGGGAGAPVDRRRAPGRAIGCSPGTARSQPMRRPTGSAPPNKGQPLVEELDEAFLGSTMAALHGVLLIAEVLGHLDLEPGLEHPLRAIDQHPARADQTHPSARACSTSCAVV